MSRETKETIRTICAVITVTIQFVYMYVVIHFRPR